MSQASVPIAPEDVQKTIAELVHEYMGIDPQQILKNTPFVELHQDFDSLAMLEIQLLLEKHYGFELDLQMHGEAALPRNVQELADELIRQYQCFRAAQATGVGRDSPAASSNPA